MEFNYRGVAILLLIGIILMACITLIGCADAADVNFTNQSYVIVGNSTQIYENSVPEFGGRIQQGQCVEIGKVYDIGGIGWWTGYIAYYGNYVDDYSPSNLSIKIVYEIPSTKEKLGDFYLDPSFFESRLGYWYVYYGIKDERGANNRIFRVAESCPLPNNTINVTITKVDEMAINKDLPLLPRYSDSDIVLARGDNITVRMPDPSRMWIGGRDDVAIYDREISKGRMDLLASDFNNAEEGIYRLAVITPGNNSIYEEEYIEKYTPEKYANYTIPVIASKFRGGQIIDIHGIQPRLVIDQLKKFVSTTIDDNLTEYSIDFQDPKIYITRISATILNENKTFLRVKGYTNCKEGTEITFTVDKYILNGITYEQNTFKTSVKSGEANEWKQFSVDIPAEYGEKFPGQHYITATTKTGASAIVPFYIRKELPAHYTPPDYLEFVDNSPFIAPIIKENVTVIVKEKEVIKTVTIVQPPEYPQLAAEAIKQILPIVIIGTSVIAVLLYCIYTYIRIREKRKEELP